MLHGVHEVVVEAVLETDSDVRLHRRVRLRDGPDDEHERRVDVRRERYAGHLGSVRAAAVPTRYGRANDCVQGW